MPIWRCPTTEHHPFRLAPTTPTSRVVDVPGRRRLVRAPLARTRSWVVVGSVLVRSMTSRLPAGTVTLAGSKRMPFITTLTVVVWPVATTPAEASRLPASGKPADVGSTTTPTATAIPRAIRPATNCPPDQTERDPGAGMPGGWGGGKPSSPAARRARREPRRPRPINGKKLTYAASTSVVVSTRTTEGTGRRLSRSPPLMRTRRSTAYRPMVSVAARTAAGPPPRTTGTR